MRNLVALASFLLLLWPSLARAEDLVLVDGRYLQVKCLEANDTKLKVLILETGGEVWIPWSLIQEDHRKRLRIRFGFEEDEAARQMFEPGVRVVTKDGEEYLGVPVAPLDPQGLPEDFEIWTNGGKKWPFKKAVVRSVEKTDVPALVAFSSQQLYDRRVLAGKPADDDLEGQWDLARYCMAIELPEKAVEHLLKVRAIDPEFESERVTNHLSRMELLAKNAAIAGAIRTAKEFAGLTRFDRALADLDQIIAVDGIADALKAQATQTREWVMKKREEHFRLVVRREYFTMLTNKLAKMARDEKVTLKEAQKELRANIHKEIVADIAAKHGLDPKNEVEKWWQDRDSHIVYTSSYGSGTFVVLGKAPGAQERDQQLQQAMARYLAQQRSQGGRNNQQGSMGAPTLKLPKPPTADEWWKNADSASRTDWMKAYYAEQCKQLKVVGDTKEDCSRCGATGVIKIDASQGEMLSATCPRCQGHRTDRAIRYK